MNVRMAERVTATMRCGSLMCVMMLACMHAHAALQQDIIGTIATHTSDGEVTFAVIAREHDLGYVELLSANPGVDPWISPRGTKIVLPTAHILPVQPRKGIVINLSTLRIYYFEPESGEIWTWPIGIGRFGLTTPLGRTKVIRKREKPTWIPTAETRAANPNLPSVVPAGPDNPMGDFALDLDWPEYRIHGTNKPFGVGRRVSRGCIRMYPEDIRALYAMATVGTMVTVIEDPVKLGWLDGELYLEVHTSQDQTDQIEESGTFEGSKIAGLRERVVHAARDQMHRIDWSLVEETEGRRLGYPIRITR